MMQSKIKLTQFSCRPALLSTHAAIRIYCCDTSPTPSAVTVKCHAWMLADTIRRIFYNLCSLHCQGCRIARMYERKCVAPIFWPSTMATLCAPLHPSWWYRQVRGYWWCRGKSPSILQTRLWWSNQVANRTKSKHNNFTNLFELWAPKKNGIECW